ncbi:MAG: hypothetical protein KJO07_04415 [Deltaproteobacteria bacterium]|nr:hypothetical protein [Deltaproteobacteria bacterium]
MSRSLKKLAKRVARCMGRKRDEVDIETEQVPRMDAHEPSSEEITQPFRRRPSPNRRTRRLQAPVARADSPVAHADSPVARADCDGVQVPRWEQPTATAFDNVHQLPAYLTPTPESLPAPSADALAVRSDALVCMPMGVGEQPTIPEPESAPSERVHNRSTRPYECPSELTFLTTLGGGG